MCKAYSINKHEVALDYDGEHVVVVSYGIHEGIYRSVVNMANKKCSRSQVESSSVKRTWSK